MASVQLVQSPSRVQLFALNLSELWELVMDRVAWRAVIHGIEESDMTERLN